MYLVQLHIAPQNPKTPSELKIIKCLLFPHKELQSP